MSTWYRARAYAPFIEPVTVVSELEKMLVIEEVNRWSGNAARQSRVAKLGIHTSYFSTFEEAKDYLVFSKQKDISAHEHMIAKLKNSIELINTMQAPK